MRVTIHDVYMIKIICIIYVWLCLKIRHYNSVAREIIGHSSTQCFLLSMQQTICLHRQLTEG